MLNRTPRDASEKIGSVLSNRDKVAILLIITLILGFGIGIFLQQSRNNTNIVCTNNPLPETTTVKVGDARLSAEVASSGEQKQQGLSGRRCLHDDAAMLFIYDVAGDYCFWMKDMRFPIDIVWLDDDKRVVTVRHDVVPDTYPESFCPERPAQYVLEVQAGVAKAQGWTGGIQFDF